MVMDNLECRESEVQVPVKRLCPDIRGSVITKEGVKRYAPVFQKAYLGADNNTIFPFGF